MIINRSHILGFGKIREVDFHFNHGLNVIFAPNEGGKSTLQRFLIAMLYGQLRSDLKIQRRIDPWVEPYKPWHAREYGGIIWCRLSDGSEIEINRSFGKEENRIQIRSSSGEDVTRRYEQQRNGEVIFARAHFGMPKELFESVGIIRENRVVEISGYETIRDRIANLAQSGAEELSIQQSLTKIQDKLDLIGSDRAPTKPYRQTFELIQSLRAEREGSNERREQFRHWIEARNRAADSISLLEFRLGKIRKALLLERRREMEDKVRQLSDLESESLRIRDLIYTSGGRADFPSENLEKLNEIIGARDSIGKHLEETRAEMEHAFRQLSQAEAERKALAAYASLSEASDAEKITEWFVNYLSISLQRDGQLKTFNRLQGEIEAIEDRLKQLNSVFAGSQRDWDRMAREAVEEEQLSSRNCAELSEKIAVERTAFLASVRLMVNRRILSGVFLVLAISPIVLRHVLGMNAIPPLADFGVGGALLAAFIVFLLSASKASKKCRKARQILASLDNELNNAKAEGTQKRAEFNDILNKSGYSTTDAFLAAAKQSAQDRQKLESLQTRLDEIDQQKMRSHIHSDELYLKLKEGLAGVGLSCSPGNLKFQIDAFRANLRRFRELDSHYGACKQAVDKLRSKEKNMDDEYASYCSHIQAILEQAQAATPEQFREECVKRNRLLELMEKEASLSREFQRLAGGLSLEQWNDRLQELLHQPLPEYEMPPIDPDANETVESEPLLPYLPSIQEAQEQEKDLLSQLAEAREEHARAVERVNQAFSNIRPSFEIDEDLALAEREFSGLELNKSALEMALEIIERLSKQEQEVLAPQLNAAVEQRFLRLCGKRYEEVKIDSDFQVWVREADSGELRIADHLSKGTQDQLYFSMRFGILDLISNPDEPCPSLLDEPFAAYDSARLAEAFDILIEESSRRQLMLFTCRDDLLDLALQKSCNVIRL